VFKVPLAYKVQQAQVLLEPQALRELAQLALQAFKGQREQDLLGRLALKAPLALRALLGLLAPLVLQVLALQALLAFKDRLALLVLARLATMTWGLSTSKTTPPPRPLRTLMIELLSQAPCSRVSYITSPKTVPPIRSSIQAPAGCFTLLPHSTLKLPAKTYAASMLAIALMIAFP
jgi:hypothetical protein